MPPFPPSDIRPSTFTCFLILTLSQITVKKQERFRNHSFITISSNTINCLMFKQLSMFRNVLLYRYHKCATVIKAWKHRELDIKNCKNHDNEDEVKAKILSFRFMFRQRSCCCSSEFFIPLYKPSRKYIKPFVYTGPSTTPHRVAEALVQFRSRLTHSSFAYHFRDTNFLPRHVMMYVNNTMAFNAILQLTQFKKIFQLIQRPLSFQQNFKEVESTGNCVIKVGMNSCYRVQCSGSLTTLVIIFMFLVSNSNANAF